MPVNLAAFYTDFKDLQLRDRRLLNPDDQATNVVVVINAAQAAIKGLEAELDGNVTPDFNIGFTGSLLDSKVEKIAPASTLILGTRLPRTPKYQFRVNGSYTLAADRTGLPVDIELAASYRRTGLSYFDINEQLGGQQPAYGIVDAQLVFRDPREIWSVMLWGKILGDTRYFSDAQSISGGRAGYVRYGEPLTFGATLSFSFD